MLFTPKLDEIRERMQLIRRLEPYMSFLGTIHSGSVPHNVDRFVRTQFDLIKAMVQDPNTPSPLRIQDALPLCDDQPSAEWRTWLIGVVKARTVDDQCVDLIGQAFDSAMLAVHRVLVQLPPQVRDQLGQDFAMCQEIWAVRARLRKKYTRDSIDSELRSAIDSAWRPVEKRCSCSRWSQLKPLLKRPEMILVWPNTGRIAKAIEEVLKKDEKAGIEVYEATIDYIREIANRLIDEFTPDWFPVDGAEPDPLIQEELLESVRSVPVQLKLENFKFKIKEALGPLPVTEEQINEALREMRQKGEWHGREIRYRTEGYAGIRCDMFVCRGRAPAKSVVNRPDETKSKTTVTQVAAGPDCPNPPVPISPRNAANDTSDDLPNPRASKDFSEVHFDGKNYTFTKLQALVISELWAAWKNGTPTLQDATVLTEIQAGKSARLKKIFLDNPAWGTIIQEGEKKGTHRLAFPEKKCGGHEIPA